MPISHPSIRFGGVELIHQQFKLKDGTKHADQADIVVRLTDAEADAFQPISVPEPETNNRLAKLSRLGGLKWPLPWDMPPGLLFLSRLGTRDNAGLPKLEMTLPQLTDQEIADEERWLIDCPADLRREFALSRALRKVEAENPSTHYEMGPDARQREQMQELVALTEGLQPEVRTCFEQGFAQAAGKP